jgi:hypothetical protein
MFVAFLIVTFLFYIRITIYELQQNFQNKRLSIAFYLWYIYAISLS